MRFTVLAVMSVQNQRNVKKIDFPSTPDRDQLVIVTRTCKNVKSIDFDHLNYIDHILNQSSHK